MKIVKGKHIGVYGIVIKNNKIALITKSRGGYKGKLDLPGGGMEFGESAFETLSRELMEEAGIVVNKADLFEIGTKTIKWQMDENTIEDLYHIGILYNVTDFSNELKQEGDGIDSLGANWYPIDSLEKDNLTPFARLAIENYNK